MRLQVAALREAGAADVADVRALARVRALVVAYLGAAGKALPARLALEGLHAGVHDTVHLQVVHRAECFVAYLAHEVFDAQMRLFVLIQILQREEGLAAFAARVRPRAFHVSFHVRLVRVLRREVLAAHFAIVRLQTLVDVGVFFQERFRTVITQKIVTMIIIGTYFVRR